MVLCFLGLIVAALACATAVGLYARSIAIVPFAFTVAAAHSVLLGGPVLAIWFRRRSIDLLAAVGVGSLIGTLPSSVFLLAAFRGTYSASIDRVPTVVNGAPTLAGWIHYAGSLCWVAFLGALAGAAFWVWIRLWKASA